MNVEEETPFIVKAIAWIDLLDVITEKILERLPLPDYIRFGAVCAHGLFVQRRHRLRHSPLPPPMLRSLPWFIDKHHGETTLTFISPWESKSHRLELPSSAHGNIFRVPSPHGWLVMVDSRGLSFNFSIFNPISKAIISLPTVKLPDTWIQILVSPPPRSVVFVWAYGDQRLLFMSKLDSDLSAWTQLQLPESINKAVIQGRRLYYISCELDFFVVDPEGHEVQLLEMDRSELQVRYGNEPYMLVESDEEVLLLVDVFDAADYDRVRKGFTVLRADVCKQKWVKVGSIGERALVVHDRGGVSLVADDHDGRGVRRNCIYFFQRGAEWAGSPGRWKVFDLGSGEMRDVENITPPVAGECMFVPSLC